MQNTLQRPIFPTLLRRQDTAVVTEERDPRIDQINDYLTQQAPVYITVERNMGNMITTDTLFGQFVSFSESQNMFLFEDLTSDINYMIPLHALKSIHEPIQ